MIATLLPPLVVAGPLALAGLMLALSHALPRRVPDVTATLVALAVAVCCVAMARAAAQGPLDYWFGGWAPRQGVTIGIAFHVDQTGAVLAAFAALLVAATLVFAWGFFDAVRAHFHVLMLLFLAAMVGFCLTHDLFNLFVWFEVMSVAAFALTGYRLEASALEGALNFTVTNTLGSYLMLAGIGLLYARAGALDFTALGHALAGRGPDPVADAAFALIAAALLIKAAMVPFQFWLADAHAVAPSPVSVIFSGIMVPLGLYGLARLTWTVFAGVADVAGFVRHLLPALGAVTSALGGVMCLQQRHLKRLLAFSTISHVGVMLVGLAALDREGLAGMTTYLVGHGLVKAALFMVAGILLATHAGIDEIGLRGKGRDIWPAGVAMAAGGLLLAGLPLGLLDQGNQLIDAGATAAGDGWCVAGTLIGAALTGAAVLRATGRIFLGLGPVPGEEKRAPSEREQAEADRPLWLMLLPAALLLLLALSGGAAARPFALRAAAEFMHATAPLRHIAPPHHFLPWLGPGLALLIAAFNLSRRHLPRWLVAGNDRLTGPPLRFLQALHSGLVGDYVTWVVVGLAVFAAVFALG